MLNKKEQNKRMFIELIKDTNKATKITDEEKEVCSIYKNGLQVLALIFYAKKCLG